MTVWMALGPNSDDNTRVAGCRYENAHAWRMLFVSTNEKKEWGGTWTKVVIVNSRARKANTIVDAYILRAGDACNILVNIHRSAHDMLDRTCVDVAVEYINERKLAPVYEKDRNDAKVD